MIPNVITWQILEALSCPLEQIEENRKIAHSAPGPRGRPSRPLLLNPTIVGSWIFCAAARRGRNPKGYGGRMAIYG